LFLEKFAVGTQVFIDIFGSEEFAETKIEAKILRCKSGRKAKTYAIAAMFLNEDILYIDDMHKLVTAIL
jgi:hypothetical protein|tara:strand:+ start:132 stop:338 length:207 start_codon:yes stop_codon:yes gene_type:complete